MRVGKIKRDAMILAEFFSTCASMQDARRDGIDEGERKVYKREEKKVYKEVYKKVCKEVYKEVCKKGSERRLKIYWRWGFL